MRNRKRTRRSPPTLSSDPRCRSSHSFGDNSYGQSIVPAAAASGQIAVSAGWQQSCSLSAAGVVLCWGSSSAAVAPTAAIAAAGGAVAVACGQYHSLAATASGAVVAWGSNEEGQCTVPAGLTGQVAVSAGYYHSCSLSAGGAVTCWGWGNDGETTVPAAQAAGGQISLSCGSYHTCAVSAAGGVTWCVCARAESRAGGARVVGRMRRNAA